MHIFQLLLGIITLASLILPIFSYIYFLKIMKLIKVRVGNLIFIACLIMLIAYSFFLSPWIFIGSDIYEIRLLSYSLISIALIILSYAVIKIYIAWRGLKI
ncbi:MAG: hypothetical protein H5T44_01060 [Thermoplasmatales archaeon]|nr:hypothetical protein [Thermoplasmatales archaeon]